MTNSRRDFRDPFIKKNVGGRWALVIQVQGHLNCLLRPPPSPATDWNIIKYKALPPHWKVSPGHCRSSPPPHWKVPPWHCRLSPMRLSGDYPQCPGGTFQWGGWDDIQSLGDTFQWGGRALYSLTFRSIVNEGWGLKRQLRCPWTGLTKAHLLWK